MSVNSTPDAKGVRICPVSEDIGIRLTDAARFTIGSCLDRPIVLTIYEVTNAFNTPILPNTQLGPTPPNVVRVLTLASSWAKSFNSEPIL